MGVFVKVHEQITGRLGHPRAGRVSGDADQVDPTVIEFNHEEYVQPGQADCLDGEEVTCERPGGLGAQELCPGRSAASGCRSEAILAQDGAH